MAYKCARRWWQKAVECAFIMPDGHPSDMNAVLVQRGRWRVVDHYQPKAV